MKKILISILTILGIGVSFCSADGIYHNPNAGLISVVVNGSTVYTLQDKNLGATCTDITQTCSYGDYFQWGNNYGFHQGNFSLGYSSDVLDWADYGPGNYFNSNGVFLRQSGTECSDSTACMNNRGGNDLLLSSKQGPCPDGYYIIGSWSTFISSLSNFGLGFYDGFDFSNLFFFPFAGDINANNGTFVNQGTRGTYWSSTSNSLYNGYDFLFDASRFDPNDYSSRYYGFSVRCFKQVVVNPTSSWVVLTGDSIIDPVEPDSIVIYYDNDQSVSISCNGTNSITINGMSSYTSGVNSIFDPYYNVYYHDEDNQELIESYNHSILYLIGKYKKTYTGDNDWIMTPTSLPVSDFTGYLPTFDITGGIDEISTSGNIFNNFAENSVKFTLSNIPSYIQYVIIIMLLFFVLGIIRKFKRR